MRKTIETKAKEHWGTTQVPQFATYMLTNGEMLNGSYMGHQRDIDHREINEFMYSIKNSKYIGAGFPYIYRFMKRGNIRMCCDQNTSCFEFWKIPTYEQWQTIKMIFRDAEELGLSIYIEKYNPNGSNKIFYDKNDFIKWYHDKVNFCLY